MVIEEKDFRLTPVNDSSVSFDLELLYKVQPRGKEARMEFKNVAYGIGLAHAVNRIAHYRVSQKHQDEAITLLTYFKEFKEELDSLKALCGI
ncbi:hypothetical protein [Intestinibacter sp.]|uniref:hypothetical protein n=1 Tax=Intestinibacter sp. TaxID=1965304 RepID=UPI003F17ECED